MRNLRRIFLLLAVGMAAQAQSWDTSGNGKLNGTYYFRQVIYVPADEYGDLGEAISLYGNITFNGNGGYTLTANDFVYYDSSSGAGTFSVANGTYSISASGYGFMSSPYVTGDSIYGLVSQQGIFVGSSTDNSYGYNDFFVAAPLASPLPTAATFSGTYVFANLDLTQNLVYGLDYQAAGGFQYNLGMTFTLNANGACGLGTTTVTGYAGTTTTPYIQTSSLPTCLFSNGAAVVTFPSNGELMSGQKYLYFSKDGNFVFGGSPYNGGNPWDMIVGVKVSSGTPNFSGLYYQAGIDDVGGDLDTYFGSLDSVTGGNILGHQRIEDLFYTPATTDFTYTDSYTLTSGSTYSTSLARYAVGSDGAGGAIRIGSGIGPYLGLSVALQAPSLAPIISSTGVFLNPQGIVNAGSWAPFTAGIAPGELLTLFNGSNLASATVVATSPFPTSLGQVQVSIGGLPAPIYYVTPTQIAAIVPYAVAGPIAMVQVTNNGVLSNAVPVYVNQTAPGVLTANQNGLGYADALRPDYSIVTAANPAVIGETIAVYLTGLGAVSPPIADGAPGPITTYSEVAAGSVTAAIGGVAATVTYAGLAPGYSGLYQLNITIPSGLTAGDNYLEIDGPDASNVQCLIPISTSTGSTSAPETAASAVPVARKQSPGRLKVDPKAKRPPSPRSGGSDPSRDR
ncbi:MAG: hypothetical protein ABSH40_00275 [Bryobacteraceae bacterium]|jgi:uncharacterized protein (TIGR03437 family)